MVALLTPESIPSVPVFSAPPSLRLIQGGLGLEEAKRVDRRLVVVGGAVLGLLLMVVGVRLGQAVPVDGPAIHSQSLTTQVGHGGVGDLGLEGAAGVVVVLDGQNMWDVAKVVAPDADQRKVVSQLANANGGVNVVAGQQVTIPLELVG